MTTWKNVLTNIRFLRGIWSQTGMTRLAWPPLHVTKQYRGLTIVYTANGVSGEPRVSLHYKYTYGNSCLSICASSFHRILRGTQQRCQQLRLRSVEWLDAWVIGNDMEWLDRNLTPRFYSACIYFGGQRETRAHMIVGFFWRSRNRDLRNT